MLRYRQSSLLINTVGKTTFASWNLVLQCKWRFAWYVRSAGVQWLQKTQCCPSPHNQSAEIVEISPAHPRKVAASGRSWTVGGRSWFVTTLSCLISTSFPLPSCTPVSSLLWLGNHNRIGLSLVPFTLPLLCFERSFGWVCLLSQGE